MPAHVFELIYCYYVLRGQFGRPPSAHEAAKWLGIDFCTVLQRRNRSIACGYTEDPGHRYRGDWMLLTDVGAEAFQAILDGTEEAICSDYTLLSLNRELFPDSIRYTHVSKREYNMYVASLTEHGQSARQS
mgnify:CR=1 FL=1